MAHSTRKGIRLPRRDCTDCGGSGFLPKEPKIGERVEKCPCWRYVSFNRSVKDVKALAAGSE
jgi:hypothetical protein